jgi:Icc-related predicted phosphoesterase
MLKANQSTGENKMKEIVCISDTHKMHRDVDIPFGDILVHAGDISGQGELETIKDFNEWMGELPHEHKIVIAGNHDFCFERKHRHGRHAKTLLTNCTYLEDSFVVVDGIKIYGTPWQPWFYDWAFNLKRGDELAAKWKLIPDDTDVLLVHGPPYTHGDMTMTREMVGSKTLLARIQELSLKLVVTGHIHEGNGKTFEGDTAIINASVCTHRYEPSYPPQIFKYLEEWDEEES